MWLSFRLKHHSTLDLILLWVSHDQKYSQYTLVNNLTPIPGGSASGWPFSPLLFCDTTAHKHRMYRMASLAPISGTYPASGHPESFAIPTITEPWASKHVHENHRLDPSHTRTHALSHLPTSAPALHTNFGLISHQKAPSADTTSCPLSTHLYIDAFMYYRTPVEDAPGRSTTRGMATRTL